jgi:hypothetical protein
MADINGWPNVLEHWAFSFPEVIKAIQNWTQVPTSGYCFYQKLPVTVPFYFAFASRLSNDFSNLDSTSSAHQFPAAAFPPPGLCQWLSAPAAPLPGPGDGLGHRGCGPPGIAECPWPGEASMAPRAMPLPIPGSGRSSRWRWYPADPECAPHWACSAPVEMVPRARIAANLNAWGTPGSVYLRISSRASSEDLNWLRAPMAPERIISFQPSRSLRMPSSSLSVFFSLTLPSKSAAPPYPGSEWRRIQRSSFVSLVGDGFEGLVALGSLDLSQCLGHGAADFGFLILQPFQSPSTAWSSFTEASCSATSARTPQKGSSVRA